VFAVDTNILVYSHRVEVAEHDHASRVVRALAEGRQAWAIPWPCLYEFYSVVTNGRIWKNAATTPSEAWQQIEAWLSSPLLRLLSETSGSAATLGRLLKSSRVRGPLVHDARIVALCLENGVEALLTRDRDFSSFPELATRNPLV
jgi:toxin-antitoxin system PIN domain toxin